MTDRQTNPLKLIATSILSILPRSGPVSGGTKVMLYGSNFVQTGQLVCKFGDVVSAGGYVSNTTMYCFAPSVSSAKTVTLEVSSNGVEFSKSRMRFTFYNSRTTFCILGLTFTF